MIFQGRVYGHPWNCSSQRLGLGLELDLILYRGWDKHRNRSGSRNRHKGRSRYLGRWRHLRLLL